MVAVARSCTRWVVPPSPTPPPHRHARCLTRVLVYAFMCLQVFLMSLKAGGVALNLTAASMVAIMDPWWNPSVEWVSCVQMCEQ